MPSGSKPLRLGLLLTTDRPPRYLTAAIDELRARGIANIAVVIRCVREHAPPRSLVVRLYERWDRRHIGARQHPLAAVELAGRFEDARHIDAVGQLRQSECVLRDADVTALRAAALDVLLCVGVVDLAGEALDAARFGCWWCRPDAADESVAGLRPLQEQQDAAPMAIHARGGAAGPGCTLESGMFAVRRSLSQAANQVQPYWATARWLVRLLTSLHASGWEPLTARARALRFSLPAVSEAPSSAKVIRWLGRTATTKVRRRFRRQPLESYWSLAIAAGAKPLTNPAGPPPLSGFAHVQPAPGHFHADPFLIQHEGARWLFFEDYDFGTRRGTIACAPVDDAGRLGAMRPALDRPYHLSYPCVFHSGADLYMVPESKANGGVELYRCRRFPEEWEFVRTLFTGPMVDTTVFQHEGRFWFFSTYVDPRGGGAELCLFSAPSLEDAWQPHPLNPISSDVRVCRGAGAITCSGGTWYRPSQDCSRAYGWSFGLNAIVALDANGYEERQVALVRPTWRPGLVGTHSYAQLDHLQVIDACVLASAQTIWRR